MKIKVQTTLGVSLRAGLFAHTAQALGTWLVSAAIPNAEIFAHGLILRALFTHLHRSPSDPTVLRWSTLSSPAAERG